MSVIKRRPEKRPKALWTQVRGARPVPAAAKRPPVKKPRKRIAPFTPERRRQLDAYRRRAQVFLKAFPLCSAVWPTVPSATIFLRRGGSKAIYCARPAMEIHHKAGRRGPALLDETKWLAVCPACHRRIHAEPALAATMGNLEPAGWRGGR